MDLHTLHRPKLFKDVIGQPDAVRTLKGLTDRGKVPHVLLFTGPSGAGKTTLARIMVSKLKCGPKDLCEMNAADDRGIDAARSITKRVGMAAISGPCRAWIVDECHQLTKEAQSSLLKVLEDTPAHVYFMLATTDPNKLLPTIRTRATEVKMRSLSEPELVQLVKSVAVKEKTPVTDTVANRIAEVADGSARKALVLLQQVLGIPDEKERLDAIQKSDLRNVAYDLAKLLLWQRGKWPQVAKVLANLDDADAAEGVRRMILTMAGNEMVKATGTAPRAFQVAEAFQFDLYTTGKAGLIMACYNLVATGGK